MRESRPIPGYPGYFATSDGRVIGKRGAALTPYVDRDGYQQVGMRMTGRKNPKRVAVHVLVALAFHGERPTAGEVRHLNGDRRDCRHENLAWGSRSENVSDLVRHGSLAGIRNPRAVITPMDAHGIRALYATGNVSQDQIARQFGLRQSHVSRIVRGLAWRRADAR